jgi:hypothetical protein
LDKAPAVRETVTLPKGFPVRPNKVVAGEAGYGELTSSERIPGDAIRKVVPIRPPR